MRARRRCSSPGAGVSAPRRCNIQAPASAIECVLSWLRAQPCGSSHTPTVSELRPAESHSSRAESEGQNRQLESVLTVWSALYLTQNIRKAADNTSDGVGHFHTPKYRSQRASCRRSLSAGASMEKRGRDVPLSFSRKSTPPHCLAGNDALPSTSAGNCPAKSSHVTVMSSGMSASVGTDGLRSKTHAVFPARRQ